MKNLIPAQKFCYFTTVFSHIYLTSTKGGSLVFETESDYSLSVNPFNGGFEFRFINPNGQILEEKIEKDIDLKVLTDKIVLTVNKYLGVLK